MERQVLQFYLNGIESQAVCQRSIEIVSLTGYLHLLVWAHRIQRAHIVQAVSQLHKDGANVIVQRVKHLLKVVQLL